MKTIKQIADEIGVSKQRVDRLFKKRNIQPHCIQGQTMQYDEAAISVATKHFTAEPTATQGGSDTASTTQNTALFDAVLKQLEEKDRVIERLQAENFMLLQRLLERKPWRLRLPWGKRED